MKRYVVSINESYYSSVNPDFLFMSPEDKKRFKVEKMKEISDWLTGKANASHPILFTTGDIVITPIA